VCRRARRGASRGKPWSSPLAGCCSQGSSERSVQNTMTTRN
jgi:hypothetical protein